MENLITIQVTEAQLVGAAMPGRRERRGCQPAGAGAGRADSDGAWPSKHQGPDMPSVVCPWTVDQQEMAEPQQRPCLPGDSIGWNAIHLVITTNRMAMRLIVITRLRLNVVLLPCPPHFGAVGIRTASRLSRRTAGRAINPVAVGLQVLATMYRLNVRCAPDKFHQRKQFDTVAKALRPLRRRA